MRAVPEKMSLHRLVDIFPHEEFFGLFSILYIFFAVSAQLSIPFSREDLFV